MTVVNFPSKDKKWQRGILLSKKGQPLASVANVMHVLAHHPEWAGVLAYDQFAEAVVKRLPAPTREGDRPREHSAGEWSETDSTRTAAWLHEVAGFNAPAHMVTGAVVALAERTPFHPLRDWLSALEWDGVARLDGMLLKYFGAPDTAYTRAVGSRFMISAAARVFKPGCKVDTMLVLESEQQGIGKSTAVRILAGEHYYADTGITVGEKDSYQALRHVWIYEFAELSAVKGRDAERVKNFLSSGVDHYRPSYGHRTRDFQRQTVFIATTNETNYLVDRTGNRRFWPVRCERVDTAALAADREQLWAEAVARFRAGEAWHLENSTIERVVAEQQRDREAPDDWTPIVAEWLTQPTRPVHPGHSQERARIFPEKGITTSDVLTGALGLKGGEINQTASTRAGHVLRSLNYFPAKNPLRRDGARVRLYFHDDTADTASTDDDCAGACAGQGA